MVIAPHSYDETCLLRSEARGFLNRSAQTLTQPPPLRSQFFYASAVPLDDPLAPVVAPQGPSARAPRPAPTPFSVHDSIALEKAWGKIQREKHSDKAEGGKGKTSLSIRVPNEDGAVKSPRKESRNTASAPQTPPSRLASPLQSALAGSPSERHTSGTPFLRADKSPSRGRSRAGSQLSPRFPSSGLDLGPPSPLRLADGDTRSPRQAVQDATANGRRSASPRKSHDEPKGAAAQEKIAVGVSRLHVVELPAFKMSPIYWAPVNDTSPVIRGTWCYRDTMLPVEAELANRLEAGYTELDPWSQSYKDELASCLEVGPEAEAKLAYLLWPGSEEHKLEIKPLTPSNTDGAAADEKDDPFKSSKTDRLDWTNQAAGDVDGVAEVIKSFRHASAIYTNAHEAQILLPHQVPSTARKRRVLPRLLDGAPVGIPVVRGFDMTVWEKLHPPSRVAVERGLKATLDNMRRDSTPLVKARSCPACLWGEEPLKTADLVLAIHGIGQKLSERVEAYHFTHIVNGFRREVMAEVQSETMRPWLRPGVESAMVLPVNWRSLTDFEPGVDETGSSGANNPYTLKDITADSLPAVRSIISDVMLDIPYYLSHYKPRIIRAVIAEANRIYRLWCHNNPGFRENGRVHIIAHSLGSVMAMDILSHQPTLVPDILSTSGTIRTDMFEFDTTNVFFCGSPAGFFLHLHHASLLPRTGRSKPGSDTDSSTSGVGGEQGTYGSLAVDNIYNLIHENDPVAYRMNACVDAEYSSQLLPAYVPGVNATWGEYLGAMLRGASSDYSKRLEEQAGRPSINRLPTTVELEDHDFTREEIAEKRMYLLNDNGQIDFLLKSGGGPLEIQYLTMLSAHSSYWTMRELVRFVVAEIGRRPGRANVVKKFVAVKKNWVAT